MPNERYELLFKNKLNAFNAKYRTNLKVSTFAKMNDAVKSFYVNGMEPAKFIALSDYKKEYKKILTTTLNQETLLNEPQAFNELVEILDTEAFYITDLVDKYVNSVNTLTRAPINVDKDGVYKSTLEIPHDYNKFHNIMENLEKSPIENPTEENLIKTIEKHDQVVLKNYYNIHEWLNELNDFKVNDPTIKNQKLIPFMQGGCLSTKEKNELAKNLIKEDIKKEHYQHLELKNRYQRHNTYHYENIERDANEFFEHYAKDNKVLTGDIKDKLVERAVPLIQMLMHKRAERSWFNVMIHPFRSHGETKAIERMVTKLATVTGSNYEYLKDELMDNGIAVYDYKMTQVNKAIKEYTNAPLKSKGDVEMNFEFLKNDLAKKLKLEDEKANDKLSDFDKKMLELENKRKALKSEQEKLEKDYYEKYPEEVRVQVEIEPEEINNDNVEMLNLINEVNKEPELEMEIEE